MIDKAVNSLASLCELGLFRKHKLFDIAKETAPVLYHPNMWIRYGVIAIMSTVAAQLKLADIHCFLLPGAYTTLSINIGVLRPFLFTEIIEINESNLLEALKGPVSRECFDKAMEAAFKLLASSAEEITSGRSVRFIA